MLNPSYQYYPTGFRIPLRDTAKQETQVDPEFKMLWDTYQKGTLPVNSFEFYSRLFKITNRLLGNFTEFLDAQDQNSKISANGYAFLEDTIQFINTGRRTVQIPTRTGICLTEMRTQTYANPKAVDRKQRLRTQLQVPVRELIFRWIQHDDGMLDMLCTCNFLFAVDLRQ